MSNSSYELNKRLDRRDVTLMPNRAVVTAALTEEEAVLLDSAVSPGQSRRILGHPYFGVNSWIRVMPEVGTEVLTLDRGDAVGDTIVGYIASNMIRRHQDGRSEKLLLRVLNPGEIELMSSGRAYVFLGSGGDLEMRGGTIRQDLLQTEQELVSISPTYVRKLHLANPAIIGAQERFGVVKRPDQKLPNAVQKYLRRDPSAASQANYAATASTSAFTGQAASPQPKDFAFEYGRWLSGSDFLPLCSVQEGHVYDDAGQEKKQTLTNKALRYERRLFDFMGSKELNIQVDQELNVRYDNGSVYSREFNMNLGNLVTWTVTADQQKFTITKTGNLSYGTSLTVTAPKVNVKSSFVGFGDNPVMPVMLAGPAVTSVLTPMVSVLQAFLQLYGADAALSTVTPQTVASAAAAATTLSTVAGQLSKCLSQQVMASG
jgi:hypothetical protein